MIVFGRILAAWGPAVLTEGMDRATAVNDNISASKRTRGLYLRPRLAAALEMLGSGEKLADIGCDHGKFAFSAIKSGRFNSAILSDVSESSLNKAIELFTSGGLADRAEFRCCDGFSGYRPCEADRAVLLGMGGELIAQILESGSKTAMRFDSIVMQPMRGEAELRRYLYENGYRILDERIVFDAGRYYQLIAACHESGGPIPLPRYFPEDYYQFGAVALEKREKELLPMMERYLSVIEKKLDSSAKKGKAPAFLIREMENTKALISLYLSGVDKQ